MPALRDQTRNVLATALCNAGAADQILKRIEALEECASNQIAFFGATPVARTSAYTQSYDTTARSHPNATSSNLTGITSSTTGSALAEPGATYAQAEMQQNFRRIQDQFVNLRADVVSLKNLINALIDDLQAYGLFQ